MECGKAESFDVQMIGVSERARLRREVRTGVRLAAGGGGVATDKPG